MSTCSTSSRFSAESASNDLKLAPRIPVILESFRPSELFHLVVSRRTRHTAAPGSARRHLGLSAGFGQWDTLLTHVPCARRCKIDGFDSANTRTPRRPADQLQHTDGQRGPSMHHARGLPRGGRSGGNGSCLGCAREAAPSAIGRPQPHVRHASRKGGKLLFRSRLVLALCRSSSSSSRRDPAHIFCRSLGVGAGRVSSCTGRERVANCA